MSAEENLTRMKTLDDAWNGQDWNVFRKRHSAVLARSARSRAGPGGAPSRVGGVLRVDRESSREQSLVLSHRVAHLPCTAPCAFVFVQTYGRAGVGDHPRERKITARGAQADPNNRLGTRGDFSCAANNFWIPRGSTSAAGAPRHLGIGVANATRIRVARCGPAATRAGVRLLSSLFVSRCCFQHLILLIQVNTRCSPVNEKDAAHCKRTQRA